MLRSVAVGFSLSSTKNAVGWNPPLSIHHIACGTSRRIRWFVHDRRCVWQPKEYHV